MFGSHCYMLAFEHIQNTNTDYRNVLPLPQALAWQHVCVYSHLCFILGDVSKLAKNVCKMTFWS